MAHQARELELHARKIKVQAFVHRHPDPIPLVQYSFQVRPRVLARDWSVPSLRQGQRTTPQSAWNKSTEVVLFGVEHMANVFNG